MSSQRTQPPVFSPTRPPTTSQKREEVRATIQQIHAVSREIRETLAALQNEARGAGRCASDVEEALLVTRLKLKLQGLKQDLAALEARVPGMVDGVGQVLRLEYQEDGDSGVASADEA